MLLCSMVLKNGMDIKGWEKCENHRTSRETGVKYRVCGPSVNFWAIGENEQIDVVMEIIT